MTVASISYRSSVQNVPAVPMLFGFFLSSRSAITLLAFQSHPAAGTALSIGDIFLFVFLAWIVRPTAPVEMVEPRSLRWIALYLGLVGVSLLWSATESWTVAVAYWAGLVAESLTVWLLLTTGSATAECEGLFTGFLAGAAFLGLIAWCLPTLPDLRIGNEDFLHPNALGYILAIATVLGLHIARRSPVISALTAFCAVTLFRTLSKACLAGFLAAIAFYLMRASHLSRRMKVAVSVVMAAVIFSGWSLVEAYIDLYDRSSHIETLTGRTYIWSVAWEEAIKTPWFGHGFYSFRFVIPVIGDFEPWQAHNELLQQFFSYGVIGVAAFLILYATFIRWAYLHRTSQFFPVAAALIIFVVVRGVADTERFDLNFPLWLMTLFTIVLGRERPLSE